MPGPRHHIYTYIISNYTKGPPVLPEGLSSQPVKDRPPTYVNSTTSSRTFLNCACASNQLWSCSFLSFAKTPQGDRSRGVTMLQASPHVIHFKSILDFGEGQRARFCQPLLSM